MLVHARALPYGRINLALTSENICWASFYLQDSRQRLCSCGCMHVCILPVFLLTGVAAVGSARVGMPYHTECSTWFFLCVGILLQALGSLLRAERPDVEERRTQMLQLQGEQSVKVSLVLM